MSEELLLVRKRAGRCISDNPIKLDLRRWKGKCASAGRLLCYKKPAHAESLELQKRIVDIIQKSEEGHETLSPMYLMGILALQENWSKEKLLKDINALSALERSGVIAPKWTSRCFYGPIKEDLPQKIEDVLSRSSRPLSSLGLLEKIPGEADGRGRKRKLNDINLICNLLDVTTKVTKLPNYTRLWSNNYPWIHNDHRFTSATIPKWNIKYAILQVLSKREAMTKAELTSDEEIRKLLSSSRTAINQDLIATSLKSPLDFLLHQSLIQTLPPINKAGRKAVRYTLTYKSRMYIENSEEYLDEEFRLALLGYKTDELLASEESTLRSVIRCIRVLREAERKRVGHSVEGENNGNGDRFKLVQKIVKSLRENEPYVRSVIYANSRPWGRISTKNLKEKLLPRLDKLSKPHAEWLRKELGI